MLITRRQFLGFMTAACFTKLPLDAWAAPRMTRAPAKADKVAVGAGTQDEVTTGNSGPQDEDERDSPSGGSQSSTKPGAGGGAGP